MTVTINLSELAQKSGKPEADIAKTIIQLLALKAEIYGITQRVRLELQKEGS